jgi:acyl dehydratase
MKEIRFDDITALQAEVSEQFGNWSAPVEINQDMINTFANLTGDKQWIHVDVERAKKESPFGGPIAHGFLILSMMSALKPVDAPKYKIVGYKSAANYGSDGLRFLSPVPAGGKLKMRSRLAKVEGKPKGTIVTMEQEFQVEGQDKPSLVYNMQVMYRS